MSRKQWTSTQETGLVGQLILLSGLRHINNGHSIGLFQELQKTEHTQRHATIYTLIRPCKAERQIQGVVKIKE